jgi:hypothetical protein
MEKHNKIQILNIQKYNKIEDTVINFMSINWVIQMKREKSPKDTNYQSIIRKE